MDCSASCTGLHPGRLRLQHGGQVERHPHGGDAGVRLAAQERGALQVHLAECHSGCMLALHQSLQAHCLAAHSNRGSRCSSARRHSTSRASAHADHGPCIFVSQLMTLLATLSISRCQDGARARHRGGAAQRCGHGQLGGGPQRAGVRAGGGPGEEPILCGPTLKHC